MATKEQVQNQRTHRQDLCLRQLGLASASAQIANQNRGMMGPMCPALRPPSVRMGLVLALSRAMVGLVAASGSRSLGQL